RGAVLGGASPAIRIVAPSYALHEAVVRHAVDGATPACGARRRELPVGRHAFGVAPFVGVAVTHDAAVLRDVLDLRRVAQYRFIGRIEASIPGGTVSHVGDRRVADVAIWPES